MKYLFLSLLLLLGYISTQAQVNILFLNAPPQGATISESGSLSPFSNVTGTPSTPQTFTFTGTNLSNNVTWSAGTGSEVSTNGTVWAGTAVYTQSGGNASGTVWVRIAAATGAGTINSQIAGTSSPAAAINVPYNATVSSGSATRTINVNFSDGGTASGIMHQPTLWNNWVPAGLTSGQTTTSGTLTDTTGTTTTVTLTFAAGTSPEGDDQSFFTDNGAPSFAAGTTSGYPDTVFELPYLFTTGLVASASDTLIINGLPSSTSNFTVELIVCRVSPTSRPATYTIGSTTIPASGTFDPTNGSGGGNLNNLVGGRVPLHWDNVVKSGANQIKIIGAYTNHYLFWNAIKIRWTP